MHFYIKDLADSWSRWEILFHTNYETAEYIRKRRQPKLPSHFTVLMKVLDLTSFTFHRWVRMKKKISKLSRANSDPYVSRKNIFYDSHLFLQRRQLSDKYLTKS